jgi:hypothetical protein
MELVVCHFSDAKNLNLFLDFLKIFANLLVRKRAVLICWVWFPYLERYTKTALIVSCNNLRYNLTLQEELW